MGTLLKINRRKVSSLEVSTVVNDMINKHVNLNRLSQALESSTRQRRQLKENKNQVYTNSFWTDLKEG